MAQREGRLADTDGAVQACQELGVVAGAGVGGLIPVREALDR